MLQACQDLLNIKLRQVIKVKIDTLQVAANDVLENWRYYETILQTNPSQRKRPNEKKLNSLATGCTNSGMFYATMSLFPRFNKDFIETYLVAVKFVSVLLGITKV